MGNTIQWIIWLKQFWLKNLLALFWKLQRPTSVSWYRCLMALISVLSEDGKTHIAEHKYKGGVYTPLDNFLNPFWLWMTELLPRTLAPNAVTLLGFLPLVVVYVLVWMYCPDCGTPLPSWLYFTAAFSMWFYQTMDCMDGKQARRLGCSTPLGQLFDHGVDCMALMCHHAL